MQVELPAAPTATVWLSCVVVFADDQTTGFSAGGGGGCRRRSPLKVALEVRPTEDSRPVTAKLAALAGLKVPTNLLLCELRRGRVHRWFEPAGAPPEPLRQPVVRWKDVVG